MKKLFFVVLTIVVLLVGGRFAKDFLNEKAQEKAMQDQAQEMTDCDCNMITDCEPEDQECRQKLIDCGCEADVEATDVVEDNPDETSDEQETVIEE